MFNNNNHNGGKQSSGRINDLILPKMPRFNGLKTQYDGTDSDRNSSKYTQQLNVFY